MSVDLNLLVVDDEESICEGCRRIFERQGFHVTKTSDAEHGLSLAGSNDYAAVLLDIKMPKMDGIQFFERLREKKPDMPVVLMTGYPSVPNAVAAIKLGAAAYVTKPFTPEEITQAVRKILHAGPDASSGAPAGQDDWLPADEGPCFFRRAWAQRGKDGTVRAGVAIDRAAAAAVRAVRLPGIGEVVFQGLPMAVLEMHDGTEKALPAPVSGVVEGVNESLAAAPGLLATDPCGAGWMARICPTRPEEELARCSARRVALYAPDAAVDAGHAAKLASFGCRVETAADADALAALLQNPDLDLLVIDAPGSAEAGLAALDRVASLRPSLKVVVAASAQDAAESAFRTRRLFYYAVEPFADNEMADILDAAFRPRPAQACTAAPAGESLMGIELTNRHGSKVHLLAGPRVMHRGAGLGAAVRKRLLDRLYPMQTRLGTAKLTPEELVGTAAGADRLVVLLAKDLGRTPGALVRDTKSEYVAVSGEEAGKVTTLVVQPGPDGTPDSLDPDTVDMLAEHIVEDLASY